MKDNCASKGDESVENKTSIVILFSSISILNSTNIKLINFMLKSSQPDFKEQRYILAIHWHCNLDFKAIQC